MVSDDWLSRERSMESRVSEILKEIRRLEEELEEAIRTQQVDLLYRIEGTKVKFEGAVQAAHRQLRTGVLSWLRKSELRNVVSAPFIYGMIVPFVILDIFISIYQAICFPLYRIPKVSRRKYIVLDRHRLSYLNSIEKFNCVYCGYVNGLIAYVREIAARTEEYWCPIKHASKILDPHRRYARFADFGDPEAYVRRSGEMRAKSVSG
jgi:hypothetical protein